MLADQPHEGSFTGEYPGGGDPVRSTGEGMECPLTRREKLPEMRQMPFSKASASPLLQSHRRAADSHPAWRSTRSRSG